MAHSVIRSDCSTVPELRSRYSKLDHYTKLRYSNRTAPVQRPILLAGELASPAAEEFTVMISSSGTVCTPFLI